jgi:hypothetical protein
MSIPGISESEADRIVRAALAWARAEREGRARTDLLSDLLGHGRSVER